MKTLQARFWSKVVKSDEADGCWNWTGALKCGYGSLARNPRGSSPYVAHRLSWELAGGVIPAGLFLCHKCDNRRCVRPSHLFIGSQADNLADMRTKGRHGQGVAFGEKIRMAALKRYAAETPEQAAKRRQNQSNAKKGKPWSPARRAACKKT